MAELYPLKSVPRLRGTLVYIKDTPLTVSPAFPNRQRLPEKKRFTRKKTFQKIRFFFSVLLVIESTGKSVRGGGVRQGGSGGEVEEKEGAY